MAGEKIYQNQGGSLVEIGARDPSRRYRMRPVLGELAYIEFTAAEDAVRDAEEAAPPAPFGGLGRIVATRAGQVTPSGTATAISFDTEVVTKGLYHSTAANPDRFTVPARQAGNYAVVGQVRFAESGAAGGGAANAGDRVVQIRVGGAAVTTARQRAAAAGDTELVAATEIDLQVGDIVRLGVLQNCGGTLPVDARITIRRISE